MLKDKLYKTWHNQNQSWGIEIISGEFKGLVIYIKEIDLQDSTNQLSVDYEMLYRPGHLSSFCVEGNSQFEDFLGSVFNDVVSEAIEVYKSRAFSF